MPRTSPDPVDLHLGTRIRMRRIEQSLSQEKLAEGLGLTFQQVQKYEKGTNRIGGSRMAAIARLLDVEVGYFYEGAPHASAPGSGIDPAVAGFMASRDGLIIAKAFCAIPDPQVRRIIALAVSKIGRVMTPKAVLSRAAE